MLLRALAAIVCVVTSIASAQTPNLSFREAGEGVFSFDTGQLKGKLQVNGKSEGIVSLVDVKSDVEIAKGGDLGMFNFYRLLSPAKRYGEMAWTWPKTAKLLPDGAVEVHWPAHEEHPVEMTATFRWKTPDAIDVETVVKPQRDLPKFELFIGSYFAAGFRGSVYVSPTRHAPGEPKFMAGDVSPLLEGAYLAFPRDLQATQLLYDGRWEQGKNPVHWAMTRFIAAPLAMRRDDKSGVTAVLMSRPKDCFGIECSYNMDKPDGVSGHFSTYLSMFGEDLKSGQPARAVIRLVAGKDISPGRAVELYQQFLQDAK
jgi:hypothetical protein